MLSAGSGNTVIKSKLISRRMFLLTISKAVVVVGVLGRLISLQINESSKYKTLSDKNRFREWKLAPGRGVIKDYFNNEIASSELENSSWSTFIATDASERPLFSKKVSRARYM